MRDTLPNRVRLGAFEVDLRAGELWRGNHRIRLQEQPFQILQILIEGSGEVVSREEIRKKLWPNDTIVEFDHSINAAIKKLRQAFGDSADQPKYVETLARRGYRLMVSVERANSEYFSKVDPSSSGVTEIGTQWTPSPGLIGKKVSHYRVLDVLGGGGMGLVYRAEDLTLGRGVALKFLPEELAWDPVALQRFEREARTASSLDHPNICTIYEVEEYQGQPFIVMQLLEGETLRDRLAHLGNNNSTLPLDELLDIAIQISKGLQAAHQQSIIHRDIKPANIFLTSAGQVKILDFGLAKMLDEAKDVGSDTLQIPVNDLPEGAQPARSQPIDATLTRFGIAMGTAGYMSPEQVRGEKLDARTDIFSFGLVLYQMATGHRAFSGDTEAALYEAIVHRRPTSIRELNSEIPQTLAAIINKALEKQREQRYQSAYDMRIDLDEVAPTQQAFVAKRPWESRSIWIITAALLSVVIVAIVLYWRQHQISELTSQDTILIAEFANLTSDPSFNDIFKPALDVEFGQTPFLNPLSPEKIAQTLIVMKKPPTERLVPAIAQEVCLRTHSTAFIAGSISDAGNRYHIELHATDCKTGKKFARASAEAGERNQIVNVLGDVGTSLRKQVGEPGTLLRRFNKPLPEATTGSIEALQAFTVGRALEAKLEAIPYLERAVELDPGFAEAYSWLAISYHQHRLHDNTHQNISKAYELRFRRLTERDQLTTEVLFLNYNGAYQDAVAKAEETLREFPRSRVPRNEIGYGYLMLGEYENAIRTDQETLRLMPESRAPYGVLAEAHLALGQLEDAKKTLDQAAARNIDIWNFHWVRYRIGFLLNNQDLMSDQLRWANTKPESADFILNEASETEAYYGRLDKADELTQRAAQAAIQVGASERAAVWKTVAALRAARAGDIGRAQRLAREALALNRTVWNAPLLAMAFASSGNISQALELTKQVQNELPQHLTFQRSDLPAVQAEVYLQQGKPDAAIRRLEPTIQYDLKFVPYFALDQAYVRGESYLKAGQAQQAIAQFRKVLDHASLVGNSINGPLARLHLGRALAMIGDKSDARQVYREFLTLWKDADADLPIYKQAKIEYAKLQ